MQQLVALLSGKKTFIIAGLMVLLGLLQGDNQMVLNGLGFAGLRLGLAKATF